jgi:hypothetical protein
LDPKGRWFESSRPDYRHPGPWFENNELNLRAGLLTIDRFLAIVDVMMTISRLVVPLRILLASTFFLLLLGQIFSMPGQFAHMAKESPEDAYLRWPLTIFSIIELLCVQIVIVCTWKLLTMVKDGSIFSERAFAWVNGIIAAIAGGWVLFAGMSLYIASKSDDPGFPALLFVMTLVGAVLGLLMIVMRALLRQATNLRTDMEAVI